MFKDIRKAACCDILGVLYSVDCAVNKCRPGEKMQYIQCNVISMGRKYSVCV